MFVVGRDAASPGTRELVGEVARAGHEIANHSFDHRIDFHKATPAQVNADLERAEQALEGICGIKPRGFRGPSYRLSGAILDALVAREYVYDTSTFPTFVGPLARAYHFRRTMLEREERRRQEDLFGWFRDGLRPLSVYRWQLECGNLIEVPVTTLPLLRAPLHMTYVNFIADISERAAATYTRVGAALCTATATRPALLLHAADFVGCDDDRCPEFLPGMRRSAQRKMRTLKLMLDIYRQRFELLPMAEFIANPTVQSHLTNRRPDVDTRG